MTDPRVPYTLLIEGGSSSTAGSVIVQDITQTDTDYPDKNKLFGDIDANAKATLDMGNMTADYSNGDLLLIKVVGIRSGRLATPINTSKGTAKIKLSQTSADYAGASVSL